MNYSDFVGVIVPATAKGLLLTRFIGAGKEAAVFAFQALDDDAWEDAQSYVTRIGLTSSWFQNGFLHHALRIDIAGYPDHPLLLSPKERLCRLVEEMFRRVYADPTAPPFAIYDHLVERIVIGSICNLDFTVPEAELAAELAADRLLRSFFDEDLPGQILRLAEEARFPTERRAEATSLYRVAKVAVEILKRSRGYSPYVANPAYRLIVQRASDAICEAEFLTVLSEPRFLEGVRLDHVEDLWWLAVTVHHFTTSTLEYIVERFPHESDANSAVPEPIVPTAEMRSFGILLCNSVFELAKRAPAGRHLGGLARYWEAKFHLLGEVDVDRAETMFKQAVELLDQPVSKRDRHDMLLTFAKLIVDHKPEPEHETARPYIMEALEIRKEFD